MPQMYLSPSTQEYNPYIDGGNEEYYMNLIADAMEPYLSASGISFERNDPGKTVGNSIAASNRGNFDFHLAIHSNAAAGDNAGRIRGVQIYYYPSSAAGKRAAEIFLENYRTIYPFPENVRLVPTTSLAEIIRTKAPTILIETAYHDNREDARWIRENIGEIAENLARSSAQFLNVPFRVPQQPRSALVVTENSPLNLRSAPNTSAEILAQIPRGTRIMVQGSEQDWYLTEYNGIQGYVSGRYLEF